nr:unnamed protein product [Callosobruchus analis]
MIPPPPNEVRGTTQNGEVQMSKKQKTSEIWGFFTPVEGEQFYSTCNICKKNCLIKQAIQI